MGGRPYSYRGRGKRECIDSMPIVPAIFDIEIAASTAVFGPANVVVLRDTLMIKRFKR